MPAPDWEEELLESGVTLILHPAEMRKQLAGDTGPGGSQSSPAISRAGGGVGDRRPRKVESGIAERRGSVVKWGLPLDTGTHASSATHRIHRPGRPLADPGNWRLWALA
jgi:hypothetical protein